MSPWEVESWIYATSPTGTGAWVARTHVRWPRRVAGTHGWWWRRNIDGINGTDWRRWRRRRGRRRRIARTDWRRRRRWWRREKGWICAIRRTDTILGAAWAWRKDPIWTGAFILTRTSIEIIAKIAGIE